MSGKRVFFAAIIIICFCSFYVYGEATLEEKLSAANSYLDSGQHEDAKRMLSELEGKMGNDPLYFISVGRVLTWEGKESEARAKFDQAVIRLDKILQDDPENTGYLLQRAWIADHYGERDKAIELYGKVLKISPGNSDAEFGLSKNSGLAGEASQEKEPEFSYRPSISLNYYLIRAARYDPWLGFTRTIEREDSATLDYSQPLRQWWTVSTGYTYSLLREIDRLFGWRDYMLDKHTFHLQNELNLPYDIVMALQFNFHTYNNRAASLYSLPKSQMRHGGSFLLQKSVWHNSLAFQFSRDFYTNPDFSTITSVRIEAQNTYTFSDDVSFHKYISSLFSYTIADRSNAEELSSEFSAQPKFIMPFYDKLSVGYQFTAATRPSRYEHGGVITLQQNLAKWCDLEASYDAVYYTLVSSVSHNGTLSLFLTPWNKTQFIVSSSFGYFDKDLTQNHSFYSVYNF